MPYSRGIIIVFSPAENDQTGILREFYLRNVTENVLSVNVDTL